MEPAFSGWSSLLAPLLYDPLPLTVVWGDVLFSAVAVGLLLICSALISGSEVAYFSLSPNDLEDLKKANGQSPASGRVLELMQRPAYLLATILITNNFINIGIIILSAIALQPVGLLVPDSGVALLNHWMEIAQQKSLVNVLVTVVAVTFMLVLFGEVSPKVYAKLYSVKLARFMSRPLLILRRLLYPLSGLLVNSSDFLEKRLADRTANRLSPQEIDQAIELTVSREQGSEREVDILRGIVKFNHIAVKEIMRARVDVQALDFDTSYHDALQQIKDWGFSRVPVFDEDLDNVTGILHVKDLLNHLTAPQDFEWQELIRPSVMYAPESQKISDLLKEFQDQRTHMAIVIDEYGGTSGIVTLEDVMEEVIGEIRDEFDTGRDMDYQKINAHTYSFEGKTMLNDISKLLDLDLAEFDEIRGEADTIAGLLLELYGFIPAKGKTITYKKYTFEVEESSRKRVRRVKLVLPQ